MAAAEVVVGCAAVVVVEGVAAGVEDSQKGTPHTSKSNAHDHPRAVADSMTLQ
jgi:hypothetical protein